MMYAFNSSTAEQTESDQTESELVNRALGESFEEMVSGSINAFTHVLNPYMCA